MSIEEFKQWWNRFEYSGNFPEPKVEHINLLLAEIERMDKVFHNQGNLREQIFDLQFEITRLNDLIGNTRLADQEAG